MSVQLTIYTRDGCHLCEDMLLELQQRKSKRPFSLNIIEINGLPELESLYGTKVPVLVHEGREICHFFLDEVAFNQCFEVG
ncbi:MAG: glutaredoxin family protein [Gammaproteobacteria bacterium]|nr:glutaredoxin family protein [Gammaproteobacteria bacterium]